MNEMMILMIILLSTAIVGTLAVRIGVPAVIGQIIVGIILGPAMLGIVKHDTVISFLAELGVILLMFMAGLESDLKLLKRYLAPSLVVAINGVLIPLIVFMVTAHLMGINFNGALFWGITFAATSVSITVSVLSDMNQLQTKEGATILGAAVVDDILAVLMLSIFTTVFGTESMKSSLPLWASLLLQLAFFVLVFVLVRWLAPAVMNLAHHLAVPSAVTVAGVVLCLALSVLAETVGLSDVVGAFFAGVAISQTKVSHEIERTVAPIGYAIFIPVFFTSIGLEMRFNNIANEVAPLIILTVLAIATKLYGGAIGAKIMKYSWNSGMAVGAGMVSRGEMSLIIVQIGYNAKLVTESQYSLLVIVIVLTTLVAPMLLKHYFNRLPKEQVN